MTDFVGRVLRPEKDDWVIRSLLDVDFYKFTMGLFIFLLHRGVEVEFCLINRNLKLPLADIVDEEELRRQLDHVRTLCLSRTDVVYLRGQDVYGHNMFPENYLAFLRQLALPEYTLRRVGNQYELKFKGSWETVTFWETIALAIISELFYRALMQSMPEHELRVLFGRAIDRLYRKLEKLKTRPWIRFADFGQRRRFSFLWQRFVDQTCREVVPQQFVGTSNTWMAFNQDLVPIGTNAHELPMVLTALAEGDEAKRYAQYQVLREWGGMFPQNALRIMLPDTYGSEQFFQNMPADLAEEVAETWRGQRQDSGDPITECRRYTSWLRGYIQPARIRSERLNIFSDGLDIDPIFEFDDQVRDEILISNGWGTTLTNDFIDCHPRPDDRAVVRGKTLELTNRQLWRGHSIVCKVEYANGRPAVKLSNNINKATGPSKEAIAEYVRIFGNEGRAAQDVVV
ncbi:MAG TPA: nicotinate phosphoribosyltransferase [Candidatus Paceibacterota bacterium]|nr:nicotinate phosphoribosyltransferase [Candidatus Paceibacterota bacterium]